MQLASRYIQTECMLPFWYVLLFGKTAPIERQWHARGHDAFEFLDDPATLTYAQTRRTQDALRKLAKRIRFTINTGAAGNPSNNCSCTTTRSKNGDARIFLSRRYFREYREAIKRKDNDRYVYLTFFLASTLCHELAHAVRKMVRGDDNFYFAGARVCEEGFEWESRSIGGILGAGENEVPTHELKDRARLRGHLSPWPNLAVVSHYLRKDSWIGVRERFSEDEVARGVDVGIIPIAWIERYFRESFWTEQVERKGPVAARLPFFASGTAVWHVDDEARTALLQKGLRLQDQSKRRGCVFLRSDMGLPRASVGRVSVKGKRRHSTGTLRVRMRMRRPKARMSMGA